MRDRKVVRISSARFESISTSAELDTPPAHEKSAPPELPEAVERGEEEALVLDSTVIPLEGVDSPPADPLPPPPSAAVLPPSETIRRMSVEFASNRMFRKISEQITQFLGDVRASFLSLTRILSFQLIDEMHAGQTEAQILLRIRKLGDLHYEKGICIPPTAWRDFKLAMMTMLTQCEYSSPHVLSCTPFFPMLISFVQERTMVMEAWNSFLAIFIREMKLSMLGAGEAQHPLVHKHSTTNVPVFERSAAS